MFPMTPSVEEIVELIHGRALLGIRQLTMIRHYWIGMAIVLRWNDRMKLVLYQRISSIVFVFSKRYIPLRYYSSVARYLHQEQWKEYLLCYNLIDFYP